MPTNTGFRGIDIRQASGGLLVFEETLQDSSGNDIVSGTTSLMILELQSDGSFKTYDFNNNQFTAGAVTTPTLAMTQQTDDNGTQNSGIWTAVLAVVSGFTVGGMYVQKVSNSSASPTTRRREFQFGGAEGDLTIDSHNNLNANAHDAGGNAITAGAIPAAVAGGSGGLPTADASNQVKANVTQIAGDTTAASNQKAAADAIYQGSVTGGTPTTTTLVDTGLTSADANAYVGRVLIFKGNTTAALANESTIITGWTPGTSTLTFTALTRAPAVGDNYDMV